ncbi:hypothetical protein Ancab_024648 [Ancistrocladus abbreviatus]
MNSSNANYGPSGFQNSNEINPSFQFSSPSMSKMGSGKAAFSKVSSFSKPGVPKIKRPVNSRSMGSSGTRKFDLGFDQFRHLRGVPSAEPGELSSVRSDFQRADNDSSVLGVTNANANLNSSSNESVNVENVLVEGIMKLRVGGQRDTGNANDSVSNLNPSGRKNEQGLSDVESLSSDVLDEMKKLNIEGSRSDQVHSWFSDLPNKLKGLDVKDAGKLDHDSLASGATESRNFAFESRNQSNASGASTIANTLPHRMRNLNLKDPANRDSSVKEDNFHGSDSVIGEITDTTILDKITKLKIEGCPETCSGSSSQGEVQSEETGKSSTVDFSFQLRSQNKDSHGVQASDDPNLTFVSPSTTFLSSSLHFQPIGNDFQAPMDVIQGKDGYVEFRTPAPKGNFFTGLDGKLGFNAKRETAKDTQSRRRKGNLKEPSPVQIWLGKNFVPKESSPTENLEPSESFSPMDVSPYQEIPEPSATEPSVTSEESFLLEHDQISISTQPSFPNDAIDEDLVSAAGHLNISEGDGVKCDQTKNLGSAHSLDKGARVEVALEESDSAVETESFKSATENLDIYGESEAKSSLHDEAQSSDGNTQFFSVSSSVRSGRMDFAFTASSSVHGLRHHRKKNRMKASSDLYSSSKNAKLSDASSSGQFPTISRGSPMLAPWLQHKEDASNSQSREGPRLEVNKAQDTKQEVISPPNAALAAKEACEKWRLRGNQAYANGDLDKAEDCYTQGMNCISPSETSRDCLRALTLCYSNRAAICMSLGRIREALGDCMAAAEIDPNFFRVQLRTANCYLALGEVGDALQHFKKVLQAGQDLCVDRKLLLEASDGLQKAEKVSECMDHSAELLQRRTPKDVEGALEVIAEALIISPYSDKLLEMKAEALFVLQRYEDVIQLCEQTLGAAEKNSPLLGDDSQSSYHEASEFFNKYSFRIWRYVLIFKSYFYLGKLEEGVTFLEKQDDLRSIAEKYGSKVLESWIPLLVSARELLHHKSAGNGAFQAGRHAEAVDHYTAALSCNVEPRPFAAVCFGNRAAAYQKLGQISDAIADCSLAIALDKNYLKAVSRRATLFEMIRDYDQAADDLQRLVSLLAKHAEERNNQPGASDRSTSSMKDLRQVCKQLSQVEEEARKEIPLDYYLILGLEQSATAPDIKKAYRKAALKHHPDKAGQFLARYESGDDELWKEIAKEVHNDADRLFKMIGEAYSVLSDPTKRFRYEEEVRNAQMKPTTQNYYESGSGRRWQEVWQSRGYEAARSSRF